MRHVESHVRLLLAGLFGVSCTVAGGTSLYRRACAHVSAQTPTGPFPVDACVSDLETHPHQFADNMARCMLEGDPDPKRLFACLDTDTRTYFEAVEATYSLLTVVLPPNTADAWGRPIVNVQGRKCSAGYDGEHGSPDDLCVGGERSRDFRF